MSLHLECIQFYKYAYYINRNKWKNKRKKGGFTASCVLKSTVKEPISLTEPYLLTME